MAHRDPLGSDRVKWRRRSPGTPAGLLTISLAGAVLGIGTLWLRSAGLGLLGTKGTAAIFVLAEGLSIGGVVFVGLSVRAAGRGNASRARDDLDLGRRWGLAGLGFVLGMFAIAACSHLVAPVMTS